MMTWRQRGLAFALAALAFVLVGAAQMEHSSVGLVFLGQRIVVNTLAVVLLSIATLLLVTSFDQGRTRAWLRLDWFLPAIRRLKANECASHSPIGRWLRQVLPASLLSDRKTKRRGLFRRTVRRVGLSWLASPLRRFSQAVCLVAFLVLFFYVCWPYDARPKIAGAISKGWTFETIDQKSGEIQFRGELGKIDQGWVDVDEIVFLVNTAATIGQEQELHSLGAFVVVGESTGSLRLEPDGKVTEELVDAFYGAS